jgi:CRISPR system Cascade subunit CasB
MINNEERERQEADRYGFIHNLYYLAAVDDPSRRPDRGALARLRRGLGKPPGAATEALKHVVPYLREDCTRDQYARERQAFFLVGALFGFHPLPASSEARPGKRNMGDVFHELGHHESAEGRFTALLNARFEALPTLLRQAVSLAKGAKEGSIPIDYAGLLRDLLAWEAPDRHVQLQWARRYWRRESETETAPTTPEEKSE